MKRSTIKMHDRSSSQTHLIDQPAVSENASVKSYGEINNITIYLPGYLRLKFLNFVSLDLKTLSGEINALMNYNIYYGNAL